MTDYDPFQASESGKVYRYQNRFLRVIRQTHPEVLEDLAGIADSEPPWGDALEAWGERYNLIGTDWIMETAGTTVERYADPDWPPRDQHGRTQAERMRELYESQPEEVWKGTSWEDHPPRGIDLTWVRNHSFSSVPEVVRSNLIKELDEDPLEFYFRTYRPGEEGRSDYREAARKAFDEAVTEYLNRRDEKHPTEGATKRSDRHFRWLAEWQLNDNRTHYDIAREASVSAKQVQRECSRLADRIGLVKKHQQ